MLNEQKIKFDFLFLPGQYQYLDFQIVSTPFAFLEQLRLDALKHFGPRKRP